MVLIMCSSPPELDLMVEVESMVLTIATSPPELDLLLGMEQASSFLFDFQFVAVSLHR